MARPTPPPACPGTIESPTRTRACLRDVTHDHAAGLHHPASAPSNRPDPPDAALELGGHRLWISLGLLSAPLRSGRPTTWSSLTRPINPAHLRVVVRSIPSAVRRDGACSRSRALLAFCHACRPLFETPTTKNKLGPTSRPPHRDALPGINNRLVSRHRPRKHHGNRRISTVFLRRLLTEALDRVKSFHPRKILDVAAFAAAAVRSRSWPSHSRPLAWTSSPIDADRLARIFMPLADIPPLREVGLHRQASVRPRPPNEEITLRRQCPAGDP